VADFAQCMPVEHNACCGAEKHCVVVFGLIIDCFCASSRTMVQEMKLLLLSVHHVLCRLLALVTLSNEMIS